MGLLTTSSPSIDFGIGTTLGLWLKPSSLGSGSVSSWVDSSGNVRNAVQATGGKQPAIINNGSGPAGGIYAKSDGTDDVLAVSYTPPIGTTIFLVIKGFGAGDSTLGRIFEIGTSGGARGIQATAYNSDFVFFAGHPSANVHTSEPWNEWSILEITLIRADRWALSINGMTPVEFTPVDTLSNAGLFLFAESQTCTFAGNAGIAEVLAIEHSTAAQRETARNYLSTRHAIPLDSNGGPHPAWEVETGYLPGASPQLYQLLIPHNYVSGQAVVYVHGREEYADPLLEASKTALVQAILGAGYLVASCAARGNVWGNAASEADYKQLYSLIHSRCAVASSVIFSQSMGGIAGLLLLSRGTVPNVKGWVGIYPACDLDAMRTVHSNYFQTEIDVTGYAGNYAVNAAGRNPVLLSAADFAGKRMRFYASPADTFVSKADNSDAMAALVNGTATENVVVACTGDHGDASHFQPSDFLSFLSRCFA